MNLSIRSNLICSLVFLFFSANIQAQVIGANDMRLSDMGGLGSTTGEGLNAAVAFNPITNQYLVVWEGTELGAATEQIRIYGQFIDAETGAEVGANDFLVAEVSGGPNINLDARQPAVIYNSTDNEFLVVFTGDVNTTTTEIDVFGQRVAANGSLIGTPFQISRCGDPGDTLADVGVTIGYPLDVAYNATDNQYLVVYRCDDVGDDGIVNGEFEVHGRIVNANGTLVGSDDFQISFTGGANGTNIEFDAESPAVAWNSTDNKYLVVYGADNQALGDGNREIFGQYVSNTGALLMRNGSAGTENFQISTTLHAGNKDSTIPDISYNSTDNEFMVVWEGDIVTDGITQIYGQRLAGNDGSFLGGLLEISENGTATNGANAPSIIYNPLENGYLVAWQAAVINGEQEIFGQFLANDGIEEGSDFRISDLGAEGNTNFDAASKTDIAYAGGNLNSFYVVWDGDDNRSGMVDDEVEVFGQAIEPVLEIEKTITSTITGSDAGDVVQYQIVVRHKQVMEGGVTYDVSLRDAYNLNLTDNLPADFENVSLVSATVNPGATDVSGAFSISGNTLATTGDVDLSRGATNGANHQTLTIVVQGEIRDDVSPDDIIAANTVDLTWQNYNPGLVHPEYEDSDATGTITIVDQFGASKTANVETATIGDVITYSIQIEVIEGTTTNIAINDVLPTGFAYVANSAQITNANSMTINGFSDTGSSGTTINIDIGSVENPGNVNNTASADVDQFVISYQATILNVVENQNTDSKENSADISADNVLADNDNTATITIDEPVLGITKTADDDTPSINQEVTFTVDVQHLVASTSDAHDIEITDVFPVGLTYVPGSASLPPAQVDEGGLPGSVTFTIPTLMEATGNTSFTYRAKVTGNFGDMRTNNIAMTWTSQPGDNANERTGGGGVNDYQATTSESVTITTGDLTVAKSDGNVSFTPGNTISYALDYQNNGAEVDNIILTETVPPYTTFNAVASTAGWVCTPNGNAGSTCTLNLGTLAASVNGSATFAVDVDNTIPAGVDQIENTVTIGSGEVIDNMATDVTPLNAAPDLTITKSDNDATVTLGGTLAYTLSVQNVGNQDATGVVITETVPANTIFNAGASTAGWVCVPDGNAGSTCTFTVGALDAGAMTQDFTFAVDVAGTLPNGITEISNTASVADDGANGADLNTDDNSATEDSEISAKITIVKSSNPFDPSLDWAFEGTPTIGAFTLDLDANDATFEDRMTFDLPLGEYTVSELNIPGTWGLTGINCEGGTVNVDLANAQVTITLDQPNQELTCTFTNQRQPQIQITKYEDLNADGQRNNGEPGLEDWQMFLYESDGNGGWTQVMPQEVRTDVDGLADYEGLTAGQTYLVCEEMRADWTNTEPDNSFEYSGQICQVVENLQYSETRSVTFGNTLCVLSVEAGENRNTCLTKTLTLTGASFGGNATQAIWSIESEPKDGAGMLMNPDPSDPSTGTFKATAPGTYILKLTTDAPGSCEPEMDTITVEVLNVDCGEFPWRGNK